jgi:multiple sugar transport system permease protein
MRKIILLGCLLYGLCIHTGVGLTQSQVTLEVWHNWAERAGQDAWNTLKQGFEQTHPGIRINLLVVPWNNSQKLLTAIVGGVPPDVTMIDRPAMPQWATRGALLPLDDLMQRDSFDGSQFFPHTWEETFYQGKHWVLPFSTDGRALFYNKKRFREAGLDPEKPPRTWTELKEYSDKLTVLDNQGRIEKLGFAPLVSAAGFGAAGLETYAWQLGGENVSADGTRITFNTTPWITALQWVVDFVDRYPGGGLQGLLGSLGDTGVYAQDPFIMGEIAMWEHGCWYLKTLRKYGPQVEYGLGDIPIPEGGKLAFLSAGFSVGLPSGCRHVNEAWEFAKYCVGREAQEQVMPLVEAIPANLAAAHSAYYMNDPDWRFFIERMQYGHHRLVTPINSLCYNEVLRAAELAITKTKRPQQALDESVAKVQKELDQYTLEIQYPLVAWNTIYWVFGIIVCGLIVIFVIYMRFTLKSKLAIREAWSGYLLASPWLVSLVVFILGPILCSIIYSLCEYHVLTPARYVGLGNYKKMIFEDELFLKSLYNTLYFTLFYTPLSILGALLLALLLNSKVRGIRLFRTVFYTPAVVSGVAVCVLWMWLLNPDSGLINRSLGSLGIQGPLWLQDKNWSKAAIVLMSLWGVGGGMIIFLAGLQGIPGQFYEAARIDGAGIWRSFFHITLPMLTPTIFFNMIVGFIGSFQIFTQAYVMTDGKGGPADSTLFYALYLFRHAFEYFNMGYASALAWILFAVVLLITLIQMATARHWVYYEGRN